VTFATHLLDEGDADERDLVSAIAHLEVQMLSKLNTAQNGSGVSAQTIQIRVRGLRNFESNRPTAARKREHNHIRITNYALKPWTKNLAGLITISKKRIHVHKASDSPRHDSRRSALKGRLY
jgi:hypothetical protein